MGNTDEKKKEVERRIISMVRAKRMAIRALLQAEKRRQQEREAEARRWTE
jgi:hypothetical protein